MIERRADADVELVVAGRTDLGRKRRNNEDALLIADLAAQARLEASGSDVRLRVPDRGVLLAVCDGMGGSEAGEVASTLALDALLRGTAAALATLAPDAALDAGGQLANREVSDAAAAPEREGMGTTLTACLVNGAFAYVAEVGDSRAYVFRAGRLTQLTKDQSYVQFLVDSGALSPGAARESMFSNVILQAVGRSSALKVGLTRLGLRRGDTLLLCTDGLSGMVGDGEIARILSGGSSASTLCTRLVDRANEYGGKDNVTVVLARVGGNGIPDPADGEVVADTLETLALYEP